VTGPYRQKKDLSGEALREAESIPNQYTITPFWKLQNSNTVTYKKIALH